MKKNLAKKSGPAARALANASAKGVGCFSNIIWVCFGKTFKKKHPLLYTYNHVTLIYSDRCIIIKCVQPNVC